MAPPFTCGDVAQVRDGYAVQTSIVRTNGTRGALLTVLRNGQASTLAVVNNVKAALPKILAGLPPELHVRQLFDQSLFVRAAINGVVREAITAAFLTGLMILMFLGSWRSTVIVCISIPLSILVSLIVLSMLGQTINVMTLGGMALAVGILVDDATVEIENTHRNMAMKKPLVRAVLDGAQQIAAPAFVSTLSHLHRVRPGAAADRRGQVSVHAARHGRGFRHDGVVPAVPYPDSHHGALHAEAGGEALRAGRAWRNGRRQRHHLEDALRLQPAFRADARRPTRRCCIGALDHRGPGAGRFRHFRGGLAVLAGFIGRDFFPTVDSGQMRLHARAPSGHAHRADRSRSSPISNAKSAHVIPRREIDTIIDNIGIPNGGFNLAFGDSPTLGRGRRRHPDLAQAGDHGPTAEYTDRLRKRLHEKFPDVTFFFEAANITNQILNFGLPAPIDVQVVGRNAAANYQIAAATGDRRSPRIPGAADVHIHQVVD